eukprot:TRINITY_DN1848_c0_g1_i1.p1 TRINITY_DN1848_c0_g1~~TRINITY_DN1848_c0_g1_i1.p1  ORF type:complete len:422 (-),score=45.53 TRINITY_DN1848_c0_g1_i1:200-1465(-)
MEGFGRLGIFLALLVVTQGLNLEIPSRGSKEATLGTSHGHPKAENANGSKKQATDLSTLHEHPEAMIKMSSSDSLNVNQKVLVMTSGAMMLLVPVLMRFQDSNSLYFAVALWGLSSAIMNVVNKIALSIIPLPLTLMLFQMVLAVVLLLVCFDGRGLIGEIIEKRQNVWRWTLLCVPFTALVVTSMMALHLTTVVSMMVVRNLLPLVALFVEEIFLPEGNTKITWQSVLSLATLAGGTFFYAASTSHSALSWGAMGLMALNMAVSVYYRLAERKLLIDPSMRLSFAGMSLINNVLASVLIGLLVFASGEHTRWHQEIPQPHALIQDRPAIACLVLSAVCGLSLGYFSIMVQKLVSCTSMLVLQTSSKLLTISFAMFALHNRFTTTTAIGCAVSMAGSFWYSYAATQQKGTQKERGEGGTKK